MQEKKTAHLSLSDRVKHHQDGHLNCKLSKYKLRSLYQRHRVSYKIKKVKRAWRRPDDIKPGQRSEYVPVFSLRVKALQENLIEIILVDECVFSQKTFKPMTWSKKRVKIVS